MAQRKKNKRGIIKKLHEVIKHLEDDMQMFHQEAREDKKLVKKLRKPLKKKKRTSAESPPLKPHKK